ncbi:MULTISPECIES: hypothetical protein [Halobacterium]|uniref:hypothetical protein n=1 Tax=Halobacterium TaxID=2239 RepID=UPI001E4F399E|nr:MULTISPECIES: hypothetical protein [Halobacterium]MCG1004893.1 hypothetical protein [Halobacterium noricense]
MLRSEYAYVDFVVVGVLNDGLRRLAVTESNHDVDTRVASRGFDVRERVAEDIAQLYWGLPDVIGEE